MATGSGLFKTLSAGFHEFTKSVAATGREELLPYQADRRASYATKNSKARMWASKTTLGFLRVGDDKIHPAVAKPNMRHLDPHRQSAKQDALMAPVELKRFSRRENQGNKSLRRQKLLFASP
jgi:hypothetical protein